MGTLVTIKSHQGVIQGDPLGSFLFALALQPLLEDFAEAFPHVPLHAFCDDMTMHQTVDCLAEALVWLRPRLMELGLEVFLEKCALYYRNGACPDLRPMGWDNSGWNGIAQDEEGSQRLQFGLQHGLNQIPGVKTRLPGSKVLGTPCSSSNCASPPHHATSMH